MPKVFSEAAIKYFGEIYDKSNARNIGTSGGCMCAAYEGISALFGKDYALKGDVSIDFRKTTSHNEYDDLLEYLEASITEKEGTFKPVKGSKWKTVGNRTIGSFEKHLIDSANCLPGNSQFYGVAVDGASHSIIVRVDKTTGNVYWMDQYSKGYSKMHGSGFVKKPDVTGKLDKEIREMGNGITRVWRFLPESLGDIEIPIDTSGDGKYDSTVPAVVDIGDASCSSQEVTQPNLGEIGFEEPIELNRENLIGQESVNEIDNEASLASGDTYSPTLNDFFHHTEEVNDEYETCEPDENELNGTEDYDDDTKDEYEICEPEEDELDAEEHATQGENEVESDSVREPPPPPEPVAEAEPPAAP